MNISQGSLFWGSTYFTYIAQDFSELKEQEFLKQVIVDV